MFEAVLIAMPMTGLAMMACISVVLDAIRFPLLFHTAALGILAFVTLLAIASGWRLFVVFFRDGAEAFREQHFGWWAIVLAGVIVLIGSLISGSLRPSAAFSPMWSFRVTFNTAALGSPFLIPLLHLVLERLYRNK